jgi:hypothetical protein
MVRQRFIVKNVSHLRRMRERSQAWLIYSTHFLIDLDQIGKKYGKTPKYQSRLEVIKYEF